MGFSHACEAVYRISKCKFCENVHLKTLCIRLTVFERESSVFPNHALEAAEAFREFTTWGSDVELEAMESEQTGLWRVNSPVEFAHEYLCPDPEACNVQGSSFFFIRHILNYTEYNE